jgi:hypothetical protein
MDYTVTETKSLKEERFPQLHGNTNFKIPLFPSTAILALFKFPGRCT